MNGDALTFVLDVEMHLGWCLCVGLALRVRSGLDWGSLKSWLKTTGSGVWDRIRMDPFGQSPEPLSCG